MAHFKLPSGPPNKPDLYAMRRMMIEAMWLDCKLFGYTTESVKVMQKKINKAKEKQAK